MRQGFFLVGVGTLSLLLGGCVGQSHAPVIEPVPPPSAAEKIERSRSLYLSVIEELIRSGKGHAALAHLDEFEREYGSGAASARLRADAWLSLGEMAKAEAGYRAILKGELAGFAKHGLGRIAAAKEDWVLAQRHFEDATKEQPTNSRFLNDFGCSLYRLARLEDAEFVLRKAHELAPNDQEIIDNILVVLAARGGDHRLEDVFPEVTGTAAAADLRIRLLALREEAEGRVGP